MKTAIICLVLILVINMFSLYYGWYLKWEWFDIPQHFLGGFFVAMLMATYLEEHLLPGVKIKNILIIAGATVFIGVVWEFAEYIANQLLTEPFYRWFGVRAYFMGDLNDTVMDLLLDISGGLLLSLFHLFRQRGIKKLHTQPE